MADVKRSLENDPTHPMCTNLAWAFFHLMQALPHLDEANRRAIEDGASQGTREQLDEAFSTAHYLTGRLKTLVNDAALDAVRSHAAQLVTATPSVQGDAQGDKGE